MKHLCPSCGQTCLGRFSGNRILIQRRHKNDLRPRRCPECHTYIYSGISPKPMNRYDKLLSDILNVPIVIGLVLLVLFLIYVVLLLRNTGNRFPWTYFFVILGLIVVPFLLYPLLVRDRAKKKIFAVVSEDFKPVAIDFNMKVHLDTGTLKHPNSLLYDYTTYELAFENSDIRYPVILGVTLLNYQVKYYELSFLGKRAGVILPKLATGQRFTITDYRGSTIGGIIVPVYGDDCAAE